MSREVYPQSPIEPLDEPVWMEVDEPGERWVAYYPVPDSKQVADGNISGLVYVYKGKRDGAMIGGDYHYGIKYDLVVKEGKIAVCSDLWVGSIFWHSGIALPRDQSKVPFEQWFSADPIPVITGQNTPDLKLLGVDEHLETGAESRE